MKNSRFQYDYRENTSKLHKAVGNCLRTSELFNHYRIYQEYPVYRINSNYSNTSHRFDWIILDLKLVIECHGIQHYKEVSFGHEEEESSCSILTLQKYRDKQKKWAAEEAGWTYIIIPYWDEKKINEDYIYDLYKINFNDQSIIEKKIIKDNDYIAKIKERYKLYRQAQYRKQKDYLDNKRREENGSKINRS